MYIPRIMRSTCNLCILWTMSLKYGRTRCATPEVINACFRVYLTVYQVCKILQGSDRLDKVTGWMGRVHRCWPSGRGGRSCWASSLAANTPRSSKGGHHVPVCMTQKSNGVGSPQIVCLLTLDKQLESRKYQGGHHAWFRVSRWRNMHVVAPELRPKTMLQLLSCV